MPDTLELLDHLVALDTTTRGSNLELVAFVEELLDRHGVASSRVPSPDGTKANLLARIGPDVEGGVVLSGHTDCVPVAGQPWTRAPFALDQQGEVLYGRGTTDMKGFLAVVLAAVEKMAGAGLRRPILLALSYDEEIGTVGAPSLVKHLLSTQARPAAVIVGEPTSMEIVTAHKGIRSFVTTVHGRDAHSSQPHRAANAVAAAARIAAFIDDLAEEHHRAAGDPRFDPPHTTFNLATITGGQAINIVPRLCELAWEYRPVPEDDGEAIREQVEAYIDAEVLPRLHAGIGEGHVETRPDALVRAMATEEDGVADRLVRELTGYDGPSRTVAFGTDGGHFQAAGLSTVVCGPGSIDQAHQPDEFVEVAQLRSCERMIEALVAASEG
jgi:acetylornithine deacetylase